MLKQLFTWLTERHTDEFGIAISMDIVQHLSQVNYISPKTIFIEDGIWITNNQMAKT